MKTALYHMAVWNVPEAGEIIKEILIDEQSVSPKKNLSVAEKIRKKAAKMRKAERIGLSNYDIISDVLKRENFRGK